jgi:hypothetical protein
MYFRIVWGGAHSVDNFLPAHALCNNYRWDYSAEEFQYILKLGVWIRTQIEQETQLGRHAATSSSRMRPGESSNPKPHMRNNKAMEPGTIFLEKR